MEAATLVDNHCHLQLGALFHGVEDAIQTASTCNIKKIHVCGVCPGDDWDRVAELARRFPTVVVPSYGLHPWWIIEHYGTDNPSSWKDALDQALVANPLAQVGECGLDRLCLVPSFRNNHSSADRDCCAPGTGAAADMDICVASNTMRFQEELLRVHLLMAHRHHRAVTLHCVKCWPELVRLLVDFARRSEPGGNTRGIVLHACAPMPPDAVGQLDAAGLARRIFYSFGAPRLSGPMSRYLQTQLAVLGGSGGLATSATAMLDLLEDTLLPGGQASFPGQLADLKEYRLVWAGEGDKRTLRIPLESVLVETDAPDQRPTFLPIHTDELEQGRAVNRPSNVVYTYKLLSLIYGVSFAQFAEQVALNAVACYGDAMSLD